LDQLATMVEPDVAVMVLWYELLPPVKLETPVSRALDGSSGTSVRPLGELWLFWVNGR
jgi:hypothetical protein